MKFFITFLLAAAMLFVSKTQAQSVSVDGTKYPRVTTSMVHTTLNPFKKKGAGALTWAQHKVNVNADKLDYLDPVIGGKSGYLAEAAYCFNFNHSIIGYKQLAPEQAQYILNHSDVVTRNVAAGQLLVLGINPATGKINCFLNPEYTEVQLVEYTAENGVKMYVSKYSGYGPECCINLVIDLYPRYPEGGKEKPGPEPVAPTPSKTSVKYGDTYITNNYYYETYNQGSWQHTEYIPYIPQGYYMIPLSVGVDICGYTPQYRCQCQGQTYCLYPVSQNKTVVQNYITINNTTNINIITPTPDIPRPIPEPVRPGTNTGGSGDVTDNHNGAGGGDHPGGAGSTGGGGTTGDNSGGTGTGGNNTGGAGKWSGGDDKPYTPAQDRYNQPKPSQFAQNQNAGQRYDYSRPQEQMQQSWRAPQPQQGNPQNFGRNMERPYGQNSQNGQNHVDVRRDYNRQFTGRSNPGLQEQPRQYSRNVQTAPPSQMQRQFVQPRPQAPMMQQQRSMQRQPSMAGMQRRF